MTGYGPVHTLIVHDVGDDDEPFHINEFADFEVIHPEECERYHDEVWDMERYRCGVGWNIDEGGLRWPLRYAGTPVTEPGTYQIQAWAETYKNFEGTEYDGGIGLVA